MGDDTTVDTDAVLAGVADGDQVSGYARDAVAWAVENGYIAKAATSSPRRRASPAGARS